MSSEWPLVSIDDIAGDWKGSMAVGPFGSRMKADLYVPSGVRVIRGNNLSGGREPEGDYVFVSEEIADSLASCCLIPGDLVFPHRGNIGEVGITPDDGLRYMLSTSLMKLSPDRGKVVPLYLMYYFKSKIGRAALLMNASQVGTPGIATPLKSLRGIQLQLPPLDVQRNIAVTLSTLDDRINLLRETNATLEAIAQALFKSWFVDFDPVRAKQQGQIPEGMDEATAALFPDSFEESELGLVPKGWRAGTIADFARQHKGAINPLQNPKVIYEHFSLPAFDNQQMPISELGTEIKSNKTSVPPDAVLLSKLNPHIPRVWLPVEVGNNAVCSTEFLVFVPAPNSGASKEFIYCAFTTAKFKELLCQLVTGTSNSHQRVKPDGISTMVAVIPNDDTLKAFGSIVKPIFERIGHNKNKAQTLARLRDTLLPRLISGQLRIAEAEDAAEEVAA